MKNKTNTIETILKDWDKLTDELFGLGKLHSWNFKDMAMTAFLLQALKTVQEETREEIVRQLELTILMWEKEESEVLYAEPLPNKIRAYIRHELKSTKDMSSEERLAWCICKEDYVPGLHTAQCLYRKRDKEGK